MSNGGIFPDIEHVVILVLENRSFDEYFGTFPGANGFPVSGEVPPVFAKAWVPSTLPYRLSTFSSQQGITPACNHFWGPMHDSFDRGAMDGWHLNNNPVACMGYYAADDIPYHWWLAQNFALCDNYFCSVMGPTAPNRFYLISGMIATADDTFTNDPIPNPSGTTSTNAPASWASPVGWQSYADFLTQAGVSWKLYDPAPNDDFILNPLVFFSSWPQVKNSASYSSDPGAFASDAGGSTLPTVSWIIPNYAYSEHPSFPSWDGAAYISQVLEPLLRGPNWQSSVLIITYDESDGHFDHVAPPQPPPGTEYSDEFIDGTAIGAGFRVPTLVISPWTLNRGVCSDPYDHTSILMFLEQVTGVKCGDITADGTAGGTVSETCAQLEQQLHALGTQLDQDVAHLHELENSAATPPSEITEWQNVVTTVQAEIQYIRTEMLKNNCGSPVSRPGGVFTDNLSTWRRHTFKSLSTITPAFAGLAPAGTVPPRPDAAALQANAWSRWSSQEVLVGGRWVSLEPVGGWPPPSPPQWPPQRQGCEVIMTVPSYAHGQVSNQADTQQGGNSATFADALQVIVDGYEPIELTTPAATTPPVVVPSGSPPSNACVTRVPGIVVTDEKGNTESITCTCTQIDFDPNAPANQTQSGVSSPFTFTYSLTFEDIAQTFSFPMGSVRVLSVKATFQVDVTVTSGATLELVSWR
jgi:phospholipase C